MNPFQTIKDIASHPLNKGRKWQAVSRYLKWQLNARINPYPVIYPFVEQSKLIMWKGLTGATGNLYYGLLEFEDMGFVLHLLRKGDSFADIGANVGTYTILASGTVGANTTCFEPVPSTWRTLQTNIRVNEMEDRVKAVNAAVGSEPGQVRFTNADNNAENHVATAQDANTVDVPVVRVDDILGDNVPLLAKMDVEGFETQALKGMVRTLADQRFKALIIELNGSGNRYGFDEEAIHLSLLENGFTPYRYDPFKRILQALETHNTVHNTIYIRDLAFVETRVREARTFRILDKEI